jgi:hypothetical protein
MKTVSHDEAVAEASLVNKFPAPNRTAAESMRMMPVRCVCMACVLVKNVAGCH